MGSHQHRCPAPSTTVRQSRLRIGSDSCPIRDVQIIPRENHGIQKSMPKAHTFGPNRHHHSTRWGVSVQKTLVRGKKAHVHSRTHKHSLPSRFARKHQEAFSQTEQNVGSCCRTATSRCSKYAKRDFGSDLCDVKGYREIFAPNHPQFLPQMARNKKP